MSITEMTTHISQWLERKSKAAIIMAKMDRVELQRLTTLRPLSEYHEDHGTVLWWHIPVQEPPYVGSGPGFCETDRDGLPTDCRRLIESGWLTHWSPIPNVPQTPEKWATEPQKQAEKPNDSLPSKQRVAGSSPAGPTTNQQVTEPKTQETTHEHLQNSGRCSLSAGQMPDAVTPGNYRTRSGGIATVLSIDAGPGLPRRAFGTAPGFTKTWWWDDGRHNSFRSDDLMERLPDTCPGCGSPTPTGCACG